MNGRASDGRVDTKGGIFTSEHRDYPSIGGLSRDRGVKGAC